MALASAGPGASLEDLNLQDCQRVSDLALRHVSQGLGSLTSLNLSFCANISDSGMNLTRPEITVLNRLNKRFVTLLLVQKDMILFSNDQMVFNLDSVVVCCQNDGEL